MCKKYKKKRRITKGEVEKMKRRKCESKKYRKRGMKREGGREIYENGEKGTKKSNRMKDRRAKRPRGMNWRKTLKRIGKGKKKRTKKSTRY